MNLADVIQRWHGQSPEAMLARASETMPFWVSLGLVIGIGFYAARLLWLLVPTPAPAPWTPPPYTGAVAPSPGTAGNAQTGYESIAAAHLFGQATAADASAADAANAPETQLNLTLRGAIAAVDDRFAHAIIADSSGNERVYFLKDAVPGGATLQQVQADRVILSRGGVLEALLLPKDSGSGAAPYRPQAPTPMAGRAAQPSMQQAITQNASTIAEIIRPQPFMPNGEMKGYRVYPGRNREQFVALGLKPGDLVTEINGMTLNNPAQAMETFKSLANTSQVTVTIERDGQAQVLTLDATQVASASGNGQPGGAAQPAKPADPVADGATQ